MRRRTKNTSKIAVIAVAPDVAGWGTVTVGGVDRRCYFDPARLAVLVPVVSDRVLVLPATGNTLAALWLLGRA